MNETSPKTWSWNPLLCHPLRLWLAACYNVTALPVAVVTFSVVITFLALTVGLLITFFVAIPFAWLMFVFARGFARFERNRVAALMGVSIADPVPPLVQRSWWGRLKERVRSRPRWREIAHHVAHLPVAVIGYALTMAWWAGSSAMLLMPLYVDALPGDSAKFHFFEITQGAGALACSAVGLAGLVLVAPWVTVGVAKVNVALARALLGPSPDATHAAQVQRLETSRSAAVDSAESERRRIERDLHDGAQQRLVALAAGLGAAKEKIDVDPEEGRRMLAEAHEEAKSALKEIRDLVRGIHPVILEDRGLDAALSAVVARSPVPVTLDVQVTDRPPPAVESAAYFVVNEALTNVAKHANATRAHVAIARAGDRLVVEVRDNGQGGADPAAGSGLQGLRDRVAGLGGSMYVISPVGGPTTVSVELPCGS
jgi:signal transduction histidine kinase